MSTPYDFDERLKYERDFAAMLKELLTRSFAGQGVWVGEVALNGDAGHAMDVLLLGKPARDNPNITLTIKATGGPLP